ncbi:hypothetical protein PHET_00729, partial [Paragonimus heterotremus]
SHIGVAVAPERYNEEQTEVSNASSLKQEPGSLCGFPLLGQVSPLWPRESKFNRDHLSSSLSTLGIPPRPVVSSLGPSSAAVGRPDKLGLQFQRTRETSDPSVILRTQPGRRKHSPSICALKQPSVEPSQPSSQLASSSENGGRRITSLCSTFSSPSSASVDTHTNVSTENLARDLQAHLRDSLSEKEQQVRCVRNRIWQENGCSENPVSLGVSPVAPLVVLSAELQPNATPLNDSTVKIRRRSFDPHVRSARQSFTQSFLFPVSLSTTGMISSISEAETDPSEYSDDVRESASGPLEDDFEPALSTSQPGSPVDPVSRGNLPDKHDDKNIQRSLSTIFSATKNQC